MNEITENSGSTQKDVANDDLLALRIRSLIADKEMVTATANMNIARGGEWLCDYTAWHGQIDQQIEALFLQANAQKLMDERDALRTELKEAASILYKKARTNDDYIAAAHFKQCAENSSENSQINKQKLDL